MMSEIKYICLILIFLLNVTNGNCQHKGENLVRSDFKNPPASVKIHTWWHWIDGMITREGITKDLESMQKQGISQATIVIVGIFKEKDFGIPRVPINSPEWNKMFKWALQEANRLGITIGIENCDGFSSSGGPWISPDMSMKEYTWTKTLVEGGKAIHTSLRIPPSKLGFYRDVAVVAYQTESTDNSLRKSNPEVTINDSITTDGVLSDGNPLSGMPMKKGDFVEIKFKDVFTAGQLVIYPRRPFMWRDMSIFKSQYSLLVSDDGRYYTNVKEFEITGLNKLVVFPFSNVKSRFFRLQLSDLSDVDSEFGFSLSEVELLGINEKPTFSETISHLLDKTVCIKTVDKTNFDASKNALDQKAIESESIVIDLSKNLSADGTLNWIVPAGNWCVIRFGYTTTGSINAPATKEGQGLECDKMDTAALAIHFRNFPQKLINQAGKYAGNTFKSFLIDSWECGYQNWSTNFAKAFETQNGYSIIKWIPVLCGETIGNTRHSEGFLYDFRKTIAALIEKNYYQYFSTLCHRQKMESHIEVIYGDGGYPPIDVLKANTYADVPMFEFWAGPPPAKHFPEPFVPQPRVKGNLPAFAANCYQLPVLAAEAYTSWADYSESPFYLKPFGDRAFCSGINQLVLHSYVHQPIDKSPGMTLGRFGSNFNRLNSWWPMTSDWFSYQNRIQYVLQKGETVSDVLYFLGDQFPQFITNNTVEKLPYGYRANGCNQDVLLNKVSVKGSKIILSPNQSYSLLILPDNGAMETSSLKRIAELVSQGAMVYGQKPLAPLSLRGRRDEISIFYKLTDKLWGRAGDQATGENKVGKGKIIWGKPIENVLQEINLAPDLETNMPDSLNIQFIHKNFGETDLYFVANQQNTTLNRECTFRISKKIPEIWDPQNGSIHKILNYSNENNLVRIPVTFSPYESLVFVFNGNDRSHKMAGLKPAEPEITEISEFTGTISFSAAYPDRIEPVEITELKSWSDFADPAIRYFSGKAFYKIYFKLPAGFTPGSDSVQLSLGKIGVVGSVRLNGKWLGNIWLPDFKMDITTVLKTDNELLVEVANEYRNRIIGDLNEFGKLQNIWTTSPIEKYLDKDKTLQPAGLLGPMRLIKFSRTRNVP